ncbi:hypothetical protein ABAZ39_13120 [Azospirillum argentinense]|uniref:Ribbon-helix-helix domain-containing protein n=1 Tax=Azospirillum argentinense TaxID=2970906 RepID=A0A060DFJ0_9PROT|nr:ribbon-helix-helix domain-containing protein [Azospirillum argentinense]AIB12911.1 hypothetical protein ABAZ39_13120 [Azospirillum argentinense]EZQ09652.1 hypothetical protein ABAZ39_14530 [Azospirillum argentinense]
MPTGLARVCRNVVVGRGRTSLRLETLFWVALDEICRREGTSMKALVTNVEERGRARWDPDACLSSAVRVYVMQYFQIATTEDGHEQAGHNTGNPFAGCHLDPDRPRPASRTHGGRAESGRGRRSAP